MRFDEFCRFQPHHRTAGDFEQDQFLAAFFLFSCQEGLIGGL
jgi:hypothetical protein